MSELSLVVLVRRADGTVFKIVPIGPIDEIGLEAGLAKEKLQLLAVGTIWEVEKIETDLALTRHVHET